MHTLETVVICVVLVFGVLIPWEERHAMDYQNQCYSQMEDVIKRIGTQPEDRQIFQEGTYRTETLWWYSKGIAYTWMWGIGTELEKQGEISIYQFAPIGN